MILEAAAWMLGALIGNAVGLALGYRLGFIACDLDRRNRQLQWSRATGSRRRRT